MQNKYEQLFDEWLDLTDFLLIKNTTETEDDDRIWSVLDKQGGNLGDIESDRFADASDIIDRMDVYVSDYILDDLLEEADAYDVSLPDFVANEHGVLYEPWEYSYWVWYRKHDIRTEKELKFIDEHKFEFDLCELIVCHIDKIDLNNCSYEED